MALKIIAILMWMAAFGMFGYVGVGYFFLPSQESPEGRHQFRKANRRLVKFLGWGIVLALVSFLVWCCRS